MKYQVKYYFKLYLYLYLSLKQAQVPVRLISFHLFANLLAHFFTSKLAGKSVTPPLTCRLTYLLPFFWQVSHPSTYLLTCFSNK